MMVATYEAANTSAVALTTDCVCRQRGATSKSAQAGNTRLMPLKSCASLYGKYGIGIADGWVSEPCTATTQVHCKQSQLAKLHTFTFT